MDIDFSHLNLQYLIQARELAQYLPQQAVVLAGLPLPLLELLRKLRPEDLTHCRAIRLPLLSPRWEPWWWERLLQALRTGRVEEVNAVLAHTGLLLAR